jgi:8-oxo-dGTP pyrophosphatase MutT (NUDIX family)
MNPADELVDVIDESRNTVGVVTRRQMREQRLPHRCTNSAGELFSHLRTATKDVFPSYWDVCIGGVLAAGETFDQGVRREIQEELGIDAVAEQLFPIAYADEATAAQGISSRARWAISLAGRGDCARRILACRGGARADRLRSVLPGWCEGAERLSCVAVLISLGVRTDSKHAPAATDGTE